MPTASSSQQTLHDTSRCGNIWVQLARRFTVKGAISGRWPRSDNPVVNHKSGLSAFDKLPVSVGREGHRSVFMGDLACNHPRLRRSFCLKPFEALFKISHVWPPMLLFGSQGHVVRWRSPWPPAREKYRSPLPARYRLQPRP